MRLHTKARTHAGRVQAPARIRVPDTLLSDLCRDVVFARDAYQCQKCGFHCEYCTRNARGANSYPNFDWAHVHTRGKKSLVWHPENSLMLCDQHHRGWWHGHDQGAGPEWFKATFPERAARLHVMAHTPGKVDRMGIYLSLRAELVTMIADGRARVELPDAALKAAA